MPATRFTWRDVPEMPEDGKRYEAIGGRLYVTPCPPTRHGLVSGQVAVALFDLLDRPKYGMTLPGVGVEFTETEEGVIPDFIFVSKEHFHIIGDDWIRGAPDLVVEVTSPTTAQRDRTIKLDFYRRLAVAEYWVVDADAEEVLAWPLAAGATEPERYTDRVPVRFGGRVVGDVELARVFQRPG